MDITRFKNKLIELKDYARDVKNCGHVDRHYRDDAEYALQLIQEIEDDIRNQEIDEMLNN